MVEAVETMDGWYRLHDMRSIDWQAWKQATNEEREKALQEFQNKLAEWEKTKEQEKGSHLLHQVIGHKADFMFMLLRPTVKELIKMEYAIETSAMGEFHFRSLSYLSVIKLSKYRPQKDDV